MGAQYQMLSYVLRGSFFLNTPQDKLRGNGLTAHLINRTKSVYKLVFLTEFSQNRWAEANQCFSLKGFGAFRTKPSAAGDPPFRQVFDLNTRVNRSLLSPFIRHMLSRPNNNEIDCSISSASWSETLLPRNQMRLAVGGVGLNIMRAVDMSLTT